MLRLIRYRNLALPRRLLLRSATSDTFVTKHFVPEKAELKRVLESLNSEYEINNDGSIDVKHCNLCGKPNDAAKTKKLRIFSDGGYNCYRCTGEPRGQGNWLQLKKMVYGGKNISQITRPPQTFKSDHQELVPKTVPLFGHPQGSEDAKNALDVLNYLNSVRGLDNKIITKYGVGMAIERFLSDTVKSSKDKAWVDHLCVTFPWMKPSADNPDIFETIRMKYRSLTSKGKQRIKPAGGDNQFGFFGWQLVFSHHKSVIITEGEYDAMAVAQALADLRQQVEVAEKERDSSVIATASSAAASAAGSNGDGTASVSDVTLNGVSVNSIDGGDSNDTAVKPATRKKSKSMLSAVTTVNGDPITGNGTGESSIWALKYKHLIDIPAISLPNGCNSLPPYLISMLEQFDKIYLWLDNDRAGQLAAEKFSKKLGAKRCVIVRPKDGMKDAPKDANDALRMNKPILIPTMLDEAEILPHERIHRFPDYRSTILSAIRNQEDREGTQTPSLERLSSICKGFRPGELVVFTGPTGAGKTTILSQLSIDFAKQGAPTLWASFEVLNEKLIQKMLRQSYRGGELTLLPSDKLERVADDFSALPLLFLNFYGASDIDDILEAMDYAVYNDDVKHVILDNLQFMLPRGGRRPYDKFDMQDVAIEKFRRFATEKKVNIILVVHPRKEEEAAMLSLSSVFGSAKATQEADVVLILQGRRAGHYTSIDVKKNRYDGSLGSVYIKYSPKLHSFVEAEKQAEAAEEVKLEMQSGMSTYRKRWGSGNGNGNSNSNGSSSGQVSKTSGKTARGKKAVPAVVIEETNDDKEDDGEVDDKEENDSVANNTKKKTKKRTTAKSSPTSSSSLSSSSASMSLPLTGEWKKTKPSSSSRSTSVPADTATDTVTVMGTETVVAPAVSTSKPKRTSKKAVASDQEQLLGSSETRNSNNNNANSNADIEAEQKDKKKTKKTTTKTIEKNNKMKTKSTKDDKTKKNGNDSDHTNDKNDIEDTVENSKKEKKQKTGWILFASEERARYTAEHPNKSGREIMKLLGEAWRGLSAEEKRTWNERAKSM